MEKFKRIFKSIFMFFMCIACICVSSCSGGWSVDEIDPDELDDYSNGINLDNVKVLRRSYGTNKATSVATGFYSDYVYNITRYLLDVYGLLNHDTTNNEAVKVDPKTVFGDMLSSTNTGNVKREAVEYPTEIENILESLQTDYAKLSDADSTNDSEAEYFKYFYDAVRYQVDSVKYVYLRKASAAPGGYEYATGPKTSEAIESEGWSIFESDEMLTGKYLQYVEIKANTSYGWNWGLNYDLTIGGNNEDAFFKAAGGTFNPSTNNITLSSADVFDLNKVSSYYSGVGEIFGLSQFNSNVYASQFYITAENPTDFQKALEYAVYCILNKEDPNEVEVTKAVTGSTFAVQGFNSVDEALENARDKYLANCAYVGITIERTKPNEKSDKEKIVDYILNNVIGESAVEWSKSADSKQNLYYEELVEAVVTYCTSLTEIGLRTTYTEFDDEVIAGEYAVGDLKHEAVSIGGQYLSSDIVDYEYNSAMVNGQNEGLEEFSHLGEYEYQSMMLMPGSDSRIDEIWLDFGFLGDGMGTNDSITINVYVRYYQGGGHMQIFEKFITVQEHSVDVGEDGTTLSFDFSELKKNDDEQFLRLDKINFNRAINSDFYNLRRAGVLQPSSSNSREITLSREGDARNYYKLVQGKYRDYGVFDYSQLSGQAYDSHYVEIAFEVQNTSCSNYKFLCGISMLTEYIPPEERGSLNGKLIPFQ